MNLFQVTKKQPSGGLELQTFTGNPVTFTTSYSEELPAPFNGINLKATILASGGGGTPATPIPIVGHSELNLVRCGLNLLDASTFINMAIDNSGNTYYAANRLLCPVFRVKSGVTYMVDIPTGMRFLSLCEYTDTNTFYQRVEYNTTTSTTITTTTDFIRLYVSKDDTSANVSPSDASTFQLEVGNVSHTYAPYNGTPYLVQFGQTVYGGVYDAKTGKAVITHGLVDLSTLPQTSVSSGRAWRIRIIGSKFLTSGSDVSNLKAEEYKPVSANAYNFVTGTVYQNLNSDYFDFCNNDSVNQAHGLVAYELATPIEIDVSELSVDTIVGVNNIVSDCGGDVTVTCLI